jgi:hypothetical protein
MATLSCLGALNNEERRHPKCVDDGVANNHRCAANGAHACPPGQEPASLELVGVYI